MTSTRNMLHIAMMTTFMSLSGCGGDTNFSHQDDDVKPVTGDSLVEFSETELRWDDIELGQTISRELTVSSVGDVDLEMYDARVIVGSSTFYLPDDWRNSRTIASGSDITLLITASLDEPMAEGILRIKCNDSNQLEFEIPLIATAASEPGDSGLSTDTETDTGL